MGRSAKLMKRPTLKQKQVAKTSKAANMPIPVAEPERVVEESSAGPKAKKRRMMRTKAEKKTSEVSRAVVTGRRR